MSYSTWQIARTNTESQRTRLVKLAECASRGRAVLAAQQTRLELLTLAQESPRRPASSAGRTS